VSDISKYESTLNDLTLIESEVAILVEKQRVISESLKEKDVQLTMLKQEINHLNKRISELEFELETAKINKQNETPQLVSKQDNEALKEKIKNLITRIDFHLSS